MRFTTIIDIRDFSWYKNQNIRLVYLHLVLCAGYHAQDQDFARTSYRRLADETGLTLSTVRHALAVLSKAQMIRVGNGGIMVRKIVKTQTYRVRKFEKTKVEEPAKYAAKSSDPAPSQPADAPEQERITYKEYLERKVAAGDKTALKRLKMLEAMRASSSNDKNLKK